MERRSGRIRTMAPKSMAEDGSDVEIADSAEAETSAAAANTAKKAPKPRKRREVAHTKAAGIQTQFKRPRGKRGLLKDVVDMPMDVLFEIFSQLEPMDLLNLARTTKDLRAILMSRASISVWKQTFTNVSPPGLPDCPPDLNEPQYAELAFGRACTFCDRKLAIIHTVWEARVRTCNKCLDSKFSPSDSYMEPHALQSHLPGIQVQRPSGRRRYGRFYIYHAIKVQWQQEYAALVEDEKVDWVKNKVAERQLISKHAQQCEGWADLRQSNLESQKATIVEERKATVVDYIRGLGWGEELEKISMTSTRPENDPTIAKFCNKEITQRGLEGITDYLNEYMEAIKSKRVFREQKEGLQAKLLALKETYTSYLLTLPPAGFYPNTADIYQDESVKEILEGTTELSAEQREILNAMFPELLQNWQEPLKRRLLQLVSETPAEKFVFDPATVLDLVSTAFMCSNCIKYMQAKQTITHRCTRDNLYTRMADEVQDLLKNTLKEVHWNANKFLTFQPVLSKQIAEVLQGCSFDPSTTKVEELEKRDPIFECLACHNVVSGRCMMRWTGLYLHANSHIGRPMKLIVVNEKDAAIARARMDEEFERSAARGHRSSLCTYCRMSGSLLGLLDHCKTTHEIPKPKPGVDIIIAPDATPDHCVYHFWPPRLKEDVEEMLGEETAKRVEDVEDAEDDVDDESDDDEENLSW